MSVQFISIVEHLRTIDFYKKQPFIKEISSKILPHCSGIVIIFGSYAKGNQKKDSDLDIFVAGSCIEKEIGKISKTYNLEINIKKYPLEVFKKALRKKDPFLEEILRSHIIISEIQQYVSCVMALRYEKD